MRLDEQTALSHPELEAGEDVLVSVNDTGHGMDADTRSRVFEPFFHDGRKSARARAWGSPPCTASSSRVVHDRSGERGEPRHDVPYLAAANVVAHAEGALESPEKQQQDAKGGTVLLVEDESFVSRIVRETLGRDGFDVLEASNGKEALDIAGRHRGAIRLVVTDLIMPAWAGASSRTGCVPRTANYR